MVWMWVGSQACSQAGRFWTSSHPPNRMDCTDASSGLKEGLLQTGLMGSKYLSGQRKVRPCAHQGWARRLWLKRRDVSFVSFSRLL
eukprot:356703-Chlamydomonas_euryale.AAC.6